MLSKIRILIENTPRSVAMPDGMTRRDRYVCSVWAHNRFLADGPKCYCKWGRQIHTSHRGQFSTQLELFCYFIGLLTVFFNIFCIRKKVNIVSHLLPVSVWSIVSRATILLPAELIPLPEEANRSRPKEHVTEENMSLLSLVFSE